MLQQDLSDLSLPPHPTHNRPGNEGPWCHKFRELLEGLFPRNESSVELVLNRSREGEQGKIYIPDATVRFIGKRESYDQEMIIELQGSPLKQNHIDKAHNYQKSRTLHTWVLDGLQNYSSSLVSTRKGDNPKHYLTVNQTNNLYELARYAPVILVYPFTVAFQQNKRPTIKRDGTTLIENSKKERVAKINDETFLVIFAEQRGGSRHCDVLIGRAELKQWLIEFTKSGGKSGSLPQAPSYVRSKRDNMHYLLFPTEKQANEIVFLSDGREFNPKRITINDLPVNQRLINDLDRQRRFNH